ncbi:SusD/RagB family nutrient-binding outer membrane lipoprotein [Aquimarina sp. AD10]|uniref:SusD/RagB family nutrient-binding outer membrane lipoprotein n=1 Tax=Aquimarina TaxID=290174 RepID=UPI000E4C3F3D|nr:MULTISPECIES: SusD/RagB family nutrient-binding outer membrane lipoprotein [Aquimarina]AXT62920.1 SusD/RagB family nutrient-binding outer membrane lipoprotein [Aquimarina sp. AD10]RKM94633.1 SusD/RagB family nutrient-binding outer membrane lipoprotein [Aquimarina sp. AD10]
MKNTYITLFVATVITLLSTSCSDDLENINSNPNNPEVVLTNTIFNSATKELTDISRGAFSSGRAALPWMQYWGQNSYADEDRYLYRESTAEDLWANYYRVGTDLKKIIELNTNAETREQMSSVGNNDNQIAASRIMLSYIFHQLTDTFGDVPYYSFGNNDPNFQALNVDNVLSPVFVTQQEIYADILSELRASVNMLTTTESVFTSGDNIFGGNAEKWRKFANSLILRVANRLRSVDAAAANAAIDEAIASGVFTSNADNAIQAYENTDATGSPLYRAYFVNNRTDFGVAAPFINLLKNRTGNFGPDPRLFQFAAPITVSIEDIRDQNYTVSTNFDDYEGVPYAFESVNFIKFTNYSFPSDQVLRADYGEVLMEYAEVSFIISERNGWSQAEYEQGVRASMERWGVADTDITTYIGTLPAASEENVLTQKYIALYMQPYEAWAEYRRTGFPQTLLLPGQMANLTTAQAADLPTGSASTYTFVPRVSITDLPTRLRYPVTLQSLNGTNRATAVSRLSDGDVITSKLFWDQN